MSPILIAATTIISLALIAYTIGVFGERQSGTLKLLTSHFLLDRPRMRLHRHRHHESLAQSSGGSISLLHPVTGGLAIALMLFHATWATCVLLRGNSKQRHNFHRLDICVWLLAHPLLHRCARGASPRCTLPTAPRWQSLPPSSSCSPCWFCLRRSRLLRCKTQRQRAGGDRLATAETATAATTRSGQVSGETTAAIRAPRRQQQIGETNP